MKNKIKTSNLFENIIFIIALFLICLPLLICFVNSIRSSADLIHGFLGMPKEITLENYEYVIERRHIFRYLINSVVITFIGTLVSAIINPYLAYIITINWKKVQYRCIYVLLSASMFIPTKLVLFPLIKIYYQFGLMNVAGLLLYYAVFMIPESVFMLVPYFRFFKGELHEAALMDGCSTMKFYKRIFFPICRPFIFTVLILNAVWIWNDFFIPLMILNRDPEMWTLPICIYNYLGKNSIHQGYSFASCQIAIIPIVIFYGVFHKRIINGLNVRKI